MEQVTLSPLIVRPAHVLVSVGPTPRMSTLEDAIGADNAYCSVPGGASASVESVVANEPTRST